MNSKLRMPMAFSDAWQAYESIQYGFTREEASKLHELASYAGPELLVEVGSMQGGSACIMESTGRDVVCIDTWENPDYYDLFLENCRDKRIFHIRAADSELWDWWKPKISLLLIDHDHSFKSTMDSLVNWRRHLAPGAVVLVHDYGGDDWPDVKPATDQSGLILEGVVGRLAWGRWEPGVTSETIERELTGHSSSSSGAA